MPTANTRSVHWLPDVLLAGFAPHSLCRSTTANAPANRQMPIASVSIKLYCIIYYILQQLHKGGLFVIIYLLRLKVNI